MQAGEGRPAAEENETARNLQAQMDADRPLIWLRQVKGPERRQRPLWPPAALLAKMLLGLIEFYTLLKGMPAGRRFSSAVLYLERAGRRPEQQTPGTDEKSNHP